MFTWKHYEWFFSRSDFPFYFDAIKNDHYKNNPIASWPQKYKYLLVKGATDEKTITDVTVNFQISPDAFNDIGTNSRFGFQLVTAYFMKVWLIQHCFFLINIIHE